MTLLKVMNFHLFERINNAFTVSEMNQICASKMSLSRRAVGCVGTRVVTYVVTCCAGLR